MKTSYPKKPHHLKWWNWLSDWKIHDDTVRSSLRSEAQYFDQCVTSESPTQLLFQDDRSFKVLGDEVNGEKIPKDEFLRELSVKFYRALSVSRISKAKELLKSIHKRTWELLRK